MATRPKPVRKMSFAEVVNAAVAEIAQTGYKTQGRFDYWLTEIRMAAERELLPEKTLQHDLTRLMTAQYGKLITHGEIMNSHPGCDRFVLNKIKQRCHAELQRRIEASAKLIKLNRRVAIQDTMQRMAGWMSSVPFGGQKFIDKRDHAADIKKELKQLPFRERRVIIDQGHKFVSALNDIVAVDGDAIAARWHSHFKQANYNFREEHAERDNKVYAVRNNWALRAGVMNKGDGYTDEITMPGQEVYCRCYYEYIYNLDDLPEEMLTKAGKDRLAAADEALESFLK